VSASSPATRRSALRRRLALIALALALTLLNAVKPLHVDDTYYYFHARQAALAPLDPHGFMVFWHERPEPASNRVAPPVLPYWLAPALRLFPDTPFVWKLWLLPFAVAFVAALFALLRRFASGLEWPLLLLTVASPAFLPSLNLMLDVPAVALSLLSLVLFLRSGEAIEDERYTPQRRLAAASLFATGAGLLAALSAQTKYTGVLVPAVLLAHAILHRRLRLWLLAAGVAAVVFTTWELFTALLYSESHFVRHLFRRAEPLISKLPLLVALCSVLGGAAPGLLPLAVLARGASARSALRALVVVLVVFFGIALVPDAILPNAATLGLGLIGALVLAHLCSAVGRLWEDHGQLELRASRFLVLWLALETLGHFALSPFPAVRRVLGVVVVATLALGSLASQRCRTPSRRALVWRTTAASALIGALFWVVDFTEARAEKRAIESASAWLREHQGSEPPRVFFVGHWGLQYYAERAGMRPVVAGRFRAATPLRAGDWLVLPSQRVDQQQINAEQAALERVHDVQIGAVLPLATLPGFYDGETPLRHLAGQRVELTVYRVTQDFVP